MITSYCQGIHSIQVQEKKQSKLIDHLKRSLASERMPTLQQAKGEEQTGTAYSRIRCDLNLTRQRANRLQIQLDTLRRLHVAAITGQPLAEAMERLFQQLDALEQQQEMKDRHLEE